MSTLEHPHRRNVIQFVPRSAKASRAGPAPVEASRSAATIIAEALWDKLGDTDLANCAVKSAVDGVLHELARLWRAEGERQASDRLTAEIAQLRGEIARRDAVDRRNRALAQTDAAL